MNTSSGRSSVPFRVILDVTDLRGLPYNMHVYYFNTFGYIRFWLEDLTTRAMIRLNQPRRFWNVSTQKFKVMISSRALLHVAYDFLI